MDNLIIDFISTRVKAMREDGEVKDVYILGYDVEVYYKGLGLKTIFIGADSKYQVMKVEDIREKAFEYISTLLR